MAASAVCSANYYSLHKFERFPRLVTRSILVPVMRDLAILLIHLTVSIARLFGPGGTRTIVPESMLVKHQLLILNRFRARAPLLRPVDRVIVGLCAILIRCS